MRKAIAFLTVFVMSISLFAQTDVAKYGDKGAPEVRIPQTWHSNNSRTEDFLLVLSDTYNDSWDGAFMDVSVNGTLIYDDITCASGASPAEFTLALNDGDIVQTAYTAGNYESEHSYAFYDNNGTLVASDGPSPGAGITFTASVSSDVPGCMTATACNYSADATADDGSCCLTNCTTIAMGGGSWIGETSWEITDATGAVVASGAASESSEFSCFDDGDYTATGTDSYGDGWNGNMLTVTDDDGSVYLSWDGPGAELAGGESASVTFTVGTPPPPAVFFSEYIEGSSNNKAIEVYNGTGETISLDDYQIGQTSNGSDPGVWEYFHIFPAGATLEAGDVWVLLNSDVSSETYPDAANADEVLDYPSVVHHNGDDARSVLNIVGTDTVVCDVIGETGPDPGSGWDVAGVTNATKDHTIVRKDAVMEGNGGDWAASAGTNADDSEWIVFDQNDFSHLGWHIIDYTGIVFSGPFGGAVVDGNTYTFPTGAESWGGFANEDVSLYPFSFPYGGEITFTGETAGTADVDIWFRFEYNPYPDVEPSYNTAAVTVSGTAEAAYTVDIPAQGDNTFSSFLLYVTTPDAPVTLDNVTVTSSPPPPCDANLVSVSMGDSYGDTWNGNTLTIGETVLTGPDIDCESDADPACFAVVDLCLVDGSYPVTCGGGSYQSEVSWEIANAAGEILLAGGAPYADVLQLGETTDVLGCTDADALNYDENATVDDGSCYFTGDSCHIAIEAVAGTNDASGENQWFTYTTTMDGILTISSQNATGDALWDTFLAVYADDCQTDVADNDDCCGYYGPSTVEIAMVAGTTYKLLWLGWYTPGPFPFTIEEGLPPTNPQNLTATSGVESVSLEWDGVLPASNRSAAIVQERRLTIEDANEIHRAKMNDIKGDEPTEVHRFSVVHPDYASNSRSTDVIIACGGGTWESEVSWEILNDAGDIVASGGAPSEVAASLDNGVYTVNGYDAYGDGWNGNVLTVTGATDNYPWLNFTLTVDDADFATTTFTMSDTPPELANLNMSNLHYDLENDAVMLTLNNTGGSTAYNFFITYYGSNETSDECENDLYDDWGSADYLEADSSLTYAVIEDASYWMGFGTFDIGAFIDWGCTVPETDETDNTITTTVNIIDPFEGVTWNVYRSEAGAEFASVGVAQSQDYLDEGLTGDVEYCYYVTQVNTEGEAESDTSNHACATATPMADLPTPTDLVGEADGWSVNLNWTAPEIGGGGGGETEGFEGGAIPDGWDMTTNAIDCGDFVGWYVTMDGTSAYWEVPAGDGYYAVSNDDECNSDGSVDYLHVPSQDFTNGGLTLSFTSFYSGAYGQTGHVLVSVDGGASYTEVYAVVAGTEWSNESVNLGAYAGESDVRVVFWSNDNAAWASGWAVDNILFSSPADFDFLAYNVYRNGEPVGMIESLDATSFDEFIAEEGDHVYYVTAVYDFYGESDPSNSDTVTVEAPAPTCNAPQNLMAESLGNDVSLSWDAPAGGAGWFGYNDGIMATAIGTGGAAQFAVAARFDQESLADYNGMSLSKIRFIHNEPTASYQAAVWTAEPGGSPVLIYTGDWMTGADIPAAEWHDVEIVDGITIDWTQELWFGYNIDTPAGYPAGCDAGPAVTGYGDLIALGGDFQSMNAAYGLNYNWMIDGFADYAAGRSIASMAPITVDYQNPNTTSELVEHRLETPVVVNTPSDRDMTNYIVYRNGEAEDTLGIGETGYNDIDVEWGDHSYYVTALYNNSDECGESEHSNTVDVSLYNNPPPAVMLLQPDDGATIAVTESNSGDDFPFIWTAVNDEDNDPVAYVVSATDETGAVHDTSMAVAGWFPTIGELAEPLLEDSVAVMTFSWNVYASDSWDSTASLNGPRTLTIDVSGLLALDGIGLPDVFALHNNYPNPFNPVTNITYDIPEVAQVTLEIYNVSGQKVRTLAQGQHEPGRYRIQWNATNDYGNPLSSGMYIYRIHAGDFVSVKKLILMK